MLSPPAFIGLGVLLASFIVSRIISVRAVRRLSSEERVLLDKSFPRLRIYGTIPLVIVAVTFFGLTILPSNAVLPAFLGAWGLLFGSLLWQGQYVQRRLLEMNISPSFRVEYSRAKWCTRGGFFVLFACTVYMLWS
jgi:hypothetical protein